MRIRIVPPPGKTSRKLNRPARIPTGHERPSPSAEKALPVENESLTETVEASPPEPQEQEESSREDENTSPFHLEFKVR